MISHKCSNSSNFSVIILTLNEELHIKRCIESVQKFSRNIIVVDSYSTDDTCKLAVSLGAVVLQNKFINHSNQINWAIENSKISTEWILRLDADEYITEELGLSLNLTLEKCKPNVMGFTINLRRIFMGRWLRHGSLYPIRQLRVWRSGKGRCENRYMDEHIVVDGYIEHINADFVDHNLKSLTWWIDKHNKYASREALELLNLEFHFMCSDSKVAVHYGNQTAMKRWLKDRVYIRLPSGFRALAYFFYRYIIRLGFLDGREGATFHFLQGFWYRYLVDVKVAEVRRYVHEQNVVVNVAIERVLGIKF